MAQRKTGVNDEYSHRLSPREYVRGDTSAAPRGGREPHFHWRQAVDRRQCRRLQGRGYDGELGLRAMDAEEPLRSRRAMQTEKIFYTVSTQAKTVNF